MDLVSETEVKNFLQKSTYTAAEDALIASLVSATSSFIEKKTNRKFGQETFIDIFSPDENQRNFVLKNNPVSTENILVACCDLGTFGDKTTEINITKSGNTIKYEWSGNGTCPNFQSKGLEKNSIIFINSPGFSTENNGLFRVEIATDDYFEIENANGVAESGKTTRTRGAFEEEREKQFNYDYFLNENAGIITFENLPLRETNGLFVKYKGGYEQVPEDIKIVVIEIIATIFNSRGTGAGSIGGAKSEKLGDYSISFSEIENIFNSLPILGQTLNSYTNIAIS